MLIIVLGIILSVAYLTLLERKLMGSMQRRIGPNKVGYLGLLQPITDGIKLILKESVIGLESNSKLFILAPFISFYLSLLNWIILPLDEDLSFSDINGAGILILIAITELGIFGVLYAGWAANSKYPLIGSLRSTAQMISYSVSLSLIILTVIFIQGDIDLLSLMYNNRSFFLLPMIPLFMISALAEVNRSPFDLPEAESELVAGFFTEHSAICFVFFFLGEYTSIITISTLFFILFFGLSISLPLIIFILWIRAVLPRLRFDQLLDLGWTNILPLTIGYIIFLPSFLFSFDLI